MVPYSFSPTTKGLMGGLTVAAAMWVDLKLEGLGFPLPNPREGRLLDQRLTSVRHLFGHSGGQVPHIKGLGGGGG